MQQAGKSRGDGWKERNELQQSVSASVRALLLGWVPLNCGAERFGEVSWLVVQCQVAGMWQGRNVLPRGVPEQWHGLVTSHKLGLTVVIWDIRLFCSPASAQVEPGPGFLFTSGHHSCQQASLDSPRAETPRGEAWT